MAGFATFASLLPGFEAEWHMSHTQAGWINAIYFGGYLFAVLVLTSLTDRFDPRVIYLICMAVSAVATLGFSLAVGFWSALFFRSMAGIGLAGTYMPGLKLLSDLIEGKSQSRALAFYTGGFGIGSSISYYLTGKVSGVLDWQTTFLLAGIGPALAFFMVWLMVPGAPPHADTKARTPMLADFRRVLHNRNAMGYVMAYAAHNWELFAMRSWVVAYIVFIQQWRPSESFPYTAATAAAVINVVGLPSSVIGNELCTRFGRPLVVSIIMVVSAGMALSTGFGVMLPPWAVLGFLVLYGVTIMGESASVTAGAVQAAEPGYRGTTMAVHSSIGFTGAFLGPLVFGMVLDHTGKGGTPTSWWFAFSSMAAIVATGPFWLLLFRKKKLVGPETI